MSIVKIQGNASGTGILTIAAPNTNSDRTLTLPDATGTMVIQNGSSNLLMNSGYGSDAVAYGCRAWVNFNGTGTVAIRASGNVSSITDNGVGDYTVNFTTAMPDANYACTYTAVNAAIGLLNDSTTVIAASVRIRSRRGDNVYEDTAVNCVAIHR